MPNSFTQIHIQFVFATKYREALINKTWRDELYKYISGIVKNNGHKLICINGMPDHIHILVGIKPSQSVSNLIQDIKGSSSKWINAKQFLKTKFEWQEGYGAFSYSKSQIKDVALYIENQELHHRKKTFREEFIEFLKEFEIEYEERYIVNELI